MAAGGAAWAAITRQLAAENITVPKDADFLPGARVDGPVSAYAQAERDSVASIFDLYPGVYDSVEVFTAPTGSLSFEYTYTQAMDKDAALEYFEGIKDQLMAQSNQTVFPAMRRAPGSPPRSSPQLRGCAAGREARHDDRPR